MSISIHLHAWCLTEAGDQEHCYPSDCKPDGWCAYRRTMTPDDPQQPFDIDSEQDFETLGQAQQYARQLGEANGITYEEIEHDY